ncbi:TetR/AcrR family transcriptional regulator [Roseobacteraceae bacterium S113]
METAKTVDGRSARKDASRTKLLDTAFQMLSVEGLDALTTRHLAEVAQMSPKTVYNVFGSKADLLKAMIEDLPNRAPKQATDKVKGDALDAVLARLDIITEEWVSQGSLIRSLLEAAKQNGQLATTMVPSVRLTLLEKLKVFKTNDWIVDAIPITVIAGQVAHANAGLFDQFLAGEVSNDDLWVSHRMNLLVPLRALARGGFSRKVDLLIRETLYKQTLEG